MALAFRQQHQARRADAVGGKDHQARRLELNVAGGVEVVRSRGTAGRIGGDLEHPCIGAQLDAIGDRRGPIGHIGRRLGLHGAAKTIGTAVVAGCPPAVGRRIYVGVRRPPVPAEAVEAARQPLAIRPERQRRHGPRRAGRVGGIAGNARAAHPLIVEIVVGLEVGVGEGPVVGDAVLAAHAEVGGMKTRSVRRPVDGAAAHGVEHQRRDVRLRCRRPDSLPAAPAHWG